MEDTSRSNEFTLPYSFGRYQLTRRLGRGGMGVVYAARDERLEREVAIKLIADLGDAAAVKRFWREARAAASVSHPHLCQIFEIDEGAHGIYLAMELLEGESLEQRLARGSCSAEDAVRITVQVLDALSAMHERGLVHRDVKPSNIFLTPHGAKLLDFGLARPVLDETVPLGAAVPTAITQPGTIIGTPRYMAPEQVRGEPVDGRCDLFSVGCVLFEMLSGRAPFGGVNVFDLLFAVLHEHPPALQGSPAVVGIDRVIRRALAKDAADRHADAAEMASALRAIRLDGSGDETVVPVRALTRLVVPPLRLQRADPEMEFLSFGLAEAMSGSLASLGDVVVRSPAVAAQWQVEGADPRRLAADADVDLALLGSLLRSGQQLRATVQLVEVASGTVLGASTVRGTSDDIFSFEEQLTSAAVGLLAVRRGGPASGPSARRDVPASAQAFEQYLRGLEYSRSLSTVRQAQQCFERAVGEDPAFAPAWAWLGRSYRVIGKYESDRSENDARGERALRRALALNPDLAIAHRFLTHAEAERGRSEESIGRLLAHSKVNRNDAHLFAGLVSACRYAGLFDASLAAYREVHRLDPTLTTGIEWTIAFGPSEWAQQHRPRLESGDRGALFIYNAVTGHKDEALALYSEDELEALPIAYRLTILAARAFLIDSKDAALAALHTMIEAHLDPEAIAIAALLASHAGEWDLALALWTRVVRDGFTPVGLLARDPLMAPLRAMPGYAAVIAEARDRQRLAAAVFGRGGGPELLGIVPVLD
jgi:TolB-like protein/tetratricopeptide (TPR) repeat protein